MTKRVEMSRVWVGQTDLEATEQFQLALWLTGLEESLAWHLHVVLDCVDVRRTADGWKLRIQARRWNNGKAGKSVVAWTTGATFYDALWLFSRQVARKEVVWKEDKYPVFD